MEEKGEERGKRRREKSRQAGLLNQILDKIITSLFKLFSITCSEYFPMVCSAHCVQNGKLKHVYKL